MTINNIPGLFRTLTSLRGREGAWFRQAIGILVGCACLGRAWGLAFAESVPSPVTLLDHVLEAPATAYQGDMMVTHWYGRYAKSEEVRVSFAPPNNYRWEFLSPDGSVERIVRSDGSLEELELLGSHRRFIGEAVKSHQKLMGEDKEKQLLLENYDLSYGGLKTLAGRNCWMLEITPKVKAKHSERVWIDEKTGVVLQVRRFRAGGHYATLSRFLSFQPQKDLPKEIFELNISSATMEHGLDPESMTLEEFKKSYGRAFSPPDHLPAGFVFESANHFQVQGKDVWHLRYTDGLEPLSVFLTNGPVRLPKHGQSLGSASVETPGQPALYGFGKVLPWKKNGQHFVLIGDMEKSWLQKIASTF